jgi:hypothetical protein
VPRGEAKEQSREYPAPEGGLPAVGLLDPDLPLDRAFAWQ